MLNATREQGYKYTKSKDNEFKTVKIQGKKKEFKILNVFEFTSDRKRMSLILKDGDIIKLYIKGADSHILDKAKEFSRKSFLDQSIDKVNYFSQYGYRTLLVGMKVLDELEYEEWNTRFKDASMDLNNKKQLMDQRIEEIEKGCYLLGATIVEDKLQDCVPETIRDLRMAGIKIWMLTGDKYNTAFNIGLSCNLISNKQKIFSIQGEKEENLKKLKNEFSKYEKENEGIKDKKAFGIIIDSQALTSILADPAESKQFLEISHLAGSVICCRVSPKQKAEVVKSMKDFNSSYITLAVGDGGNDVSMIMEAHIGIFY